MTQIRESRGGAHAASYPHEDQLGAVQVRVGAEEARWKAAGSTPVGIKAPVPIEVWSAKKLDEPTAGNVAVPTMRIGVGAM